MNAWMAPAGVSMDAGYIVYTKDTDLSRPGAANLVVFTDENPYSINDGFFIEVSLTAWYDIPASYHNGAGGLAFADGHAQLHKWTDPAVLKQSQPVSGNPISATGVDAYWLMEHMSARQ